MYEKIVVDKNALKYLVGYVYSLLEFIDVDDFEEEKNRRLVVDGFDEYVKPMMSEDFENPFAFVKNDEIEVFKERLEDDFDTNSFNISFKEAKEIYETLSDKLANDDTYNAIYNESLEEVLKEYEKAKETSLEKTINKAKHICEDVNKGEVDKPEIDLEI